MQKKSSFTLIEILIAFSILVITMPLFLRVLPFSAQTARLSARKTQAIALCQEKLEEYLSLTYAEVPVGAVEARANLIDEDFTYFEREVNIQYLEEDLSEASEDQGLKKILVTVWWQQGGKEYSEQLVSLKTKL